jgi:hypothetical protein
MVGQRGGGGVGMKQTVRERETDRTKKLTSETYIYDYNVVPFFVHIYIYTGI